MSVVACTSWPIQGGLSVLRIDRAADADVYHEPNIWMRHV